MKLKHRPRTNSYLELQGNDNTSETKTCVTREVETEVQNQKIDPEAISKTPDSTTVTISIAQKVKVFREAASCFHFLCLLLKSFT